MPMSHVRARMKLLGLQRDDLRSADAVYALSLWFGTSYAAMVWHLVSLKLVRGDIAQQLIKVRPKTIKEALGGHDALADWHNDVWPLTAARSGETLRARVGDTLAITLPSHASGGYLWGATGRSADALELLSLEPLGMGVASQAVVPEAGQSLEQQALVRVRRDGAHTLELMERRPWAPSVAASEFRVTVVAQAPFEQGLAPRSRTQHLQIVRG
jgi:hypothetical protein